MGYSLNDSGASREHAQIMRRAQDGSVHMQRSLPSSSYPARSTLTLNVGIIHPTPNSSAYIFYYGRGKYETSLPPPTPPPPPRFR